MKHYFTKKEKLLWGLSVGLILFSFLLFDRENYLTLAASLIGVTSLIFTAKGNPIGQLLMVIFSLLYGVISWTFAYYGEMLTYLGMTMPMAIFSMVTWMRNPYQGNHAEVAVNRIKWQEWLLIVVMTGVVTAAFGYLLMRLHTANLVFSTISVATSFLAVYLTFRRSAYYALGYAANDVVLIILWVLASMEDTRYVSVVVCFAAFLLNDLYGFISWQKMQKRQGKTNEHVTNG